MTHAIKHTLCLSALSLFTVLFSFGQTQTNPDNPWSLNRPKEFCDFVSNAIANKYYQGGDLNELNYNSGYQWKVWCAQASTPVMNGPSTSSGKAGELNFKQRAIVTAVQGSWVQITRDQDNEQPFGWVNASNLLLSPWALKTSGGIGRKALVVPNLGLQSTPAQQEARTQLYDHPKVSSRDVMNGRHAGRFKVLYILKTSDKSMLLSTAPFLEGSDAQSTILGWMPKRYLTEWNRRVAYAPTFGEGAPVGQKIPFFDSKAQADNYTASCDDSQARQRSQVLPQEQVPSVPAYPDIGPATGRRLNNKHRELLTIVGVSSNPAGVENEIQVRSKIRALEERIGTVNLLFVVDATASMGKYYPAISKSIQTVTEWSSDWSETVHMNVGFGVYRDYLDGPACIENQPVRAFDEDLANYISTQVKCHSKDRDKPEAVYKGIVDNLAEWNPNPNETNIVILIGDEGNHENDNQYTFDQVQEALDRTRASLFVFQASAFMTESSVRFQSDALQWISKIQEDNARNQVNCSIERKKAGVFGIAFSETESIMQRRQAVLITQAQRAGRKTPPEVMAAVIKDDLTAWIRTIENQIRRFESLLDGTISLTGKEKEALIEKLQGMVLSRQKAEAFLERGGDLAVERHASIETCTAEQILTPYIFLSNEDYNRITNQFSRLEAGGTAVDKAEALQSLCLSLIRTQAGSPAEVQRLSEKTMSEIWIEFFQMDFNIAALKDVKVRNISGLSGAAFENAYDQLLEAAQQWEELEIDEREWRVASTRNQKYYWVDAEFFPGFGE